MGRLEKIVVLTVLFLVAVILAVSLNRDEVIAGPQAPEVAQLAPAEPVSGGADDFRAPQRALSGSVEDSPAVADTGADVALTPPEEEVVVPPAPEPVQEAKPKSMLRTTAGLEASLVPELMLYTWQAGDSFTSIADRYYGSRLEVGKLRAANEGRDESAIAVGERVFVPVEAVAAAERLGRVSDQAGQWLGGTYVVESGDMLGVIAKKTYGSASQWKKIYEANLDVLTSPDALKVGMRLRIPAQ